MKERFFFGFWLGLLVFVFFSCKEVEDDPGEVLVSIKMKEIMEPSLAIEEGDIFVEEFLFEAETEGGKHVSFNEALEQKVSFSKRGGGVFLNFFIPPAVYREMNIRLSLQGDGEQPSIFLKGKKQRAGLENLPFVFENTVDELLELNVARSQTGQPMVVRRGSENNIELEVNPEVWFQTIGPAQWVAGEIIPFQSQHVLLINNQYNQGMFQVINGRIKQSFSAKFK